ncbi:MAG TPA: DUF1932 domain-containing protein [Caulobacterales bacterium]|nr:DUF1932 domain-containing protein [Caulobacterales bacterium]
MTRIAIIGFGEVGAILADDLAPRAALSAWDTQFVNADSAPSRAAASRNLRVATSAADAASDADVAISAVTAAQTEAAAQAAAPGLAKGAFYLDLNSASPAAKIAASDVVEKVGGLYVEAAVMAPIQPKRLNTPILLGGPRAEDFLSGAKDLGFGGARMYDRALGKAAAAKLCRSVMVKGVEALLVESLLAARHYQVEDEVVASLANMFPGANWSTLSRYMMSRAIEHGRRRAEEMREAAKTVADAGLDPLMSTACAARQDWAAEALGGAHGDDLVTLLDAMERALKDKN